MPAYHVLGQAKVGGEAVVDLFAPLAKGRSRQSKDPLSSGGIRQWLLVQIYAKHSGSNAGARVERRCRDPLHQARLAV